MDKLAVPWVFVGPSGSGKVQLARRWIEEAHGVKIAYPMEVRTFSVGDGYEARVITSPYHFEIDIPNLSMQDKQIIGELLTMFLSSGDVLNSLRSSARKLVILRRAHCLSLPAAIRVRAILQQYVLPATASGMIWITTREITGPLALLDDAFVRFRVPRITLSQWKSHERVPEQFRTDVAWNKLEGRPERAIAMAQHFPEAGPEMEWPRRTQDYYDEMIAQMVRGSRRIKEPNINVVQWLRARVYEALSFCQTGPEIIDQCAAAVVRNSSLFEPEVFWNVLAALSESEPHTSYRTPLSLEWAFFNMFEEMRKTRTEHRDDAGTLDDDAGEQRCPSAPKPGARGGAKTVRGSCTGTKEPVKRRAPARKKTE
jgi:hypothetical protein